MDQGPAVKVIDDFVHSRLGHTGAAGFEGLVALLLQRATGQEFRLSSSGRQSGRDAGSESGYGNNIKVETKHYRKTTPLDLRELTAEVDQAAESDENLDIWVLAASRSVDEQMASSLEKHGETYGIEILFLDVGLNGLPRLAVLMAAFPDVIVGWANQHQLKYDENDVRSALSTVAGAPDFDLAKTRLLAKLLNVVGYDSARHRIHAKLLAVVSDKQEAQSLFHQPLAIRSPDAHVIRRIALNAEFDKWWDATGVPRPAVALGEEGTGKTWAVFDWAVGRLESGDMPIVLTFAAVAEELAKSETLEALIPRLLTRWTGVLDENRWKRRFGRWLKSEPTGKPLMLLIIDGLNERADFNWRPLFSALMSAPWQDKIAVLATDRPHHWRDRSSLAGLAPFHEIGVGGYSPAELDQALSASAISYAEIPLEMLPLISIPRYCRLVVEHYQDMIDAADFTRDRLIYLEIKDRPASKLQYPLTDERLFEIVRDLAKQARVNLELNPKDLRSLIAEPGGDEANIYEEILGGGLLVPVTRNSMILTYRVEPVRMVYGFGMLLAADLRGESFADDSEVEEFLMFWFEPQPDMDRKVEICGSALFHALFQNDFPEVTLRGLIRYWLGLRNWADTAQSAFTSYVRRRPKLFVEVVEEFWSATRDSGAAQAFLGEALRANRDDPNVQEVLAPAIERWMGFVHPLGRRFWEFDRARNEMTRKRMAALSGQQVSLPADELGKEERTRREVESRAGCPVVPGQIEVAGTKLTVISDGSLLRLARFGLMIMSAGDRSPFVHSLVHWAVASAVMGDSEFGDIVSWVIRLSDWDIDTAVVGEARRLLARNEAIASRAALSLLSAVGSKESEPLIEEHDLTPDWYKERRREHLSDPCRSLFSWTESEALSCLGREDVPLHMILERATLPMADPAVSLPASLIGRAKEALGLIDPVMIRASSAHTAQDHQLGTLTPILWARAPVEVANFMRAVVRTLPDRKLSGQYFLAIGLPEISLLLSAEEVSAISRTIGDLSADASDWSFQNQSGPPQMRKIAEALSFNAIAPHLSPSDLFRRSIARPVNALDLAGLEQWFAPVPQEDASEAIRLLHAPPEDSMLRRILWELPYLQVSLAEPERNRLVQLADSADANVRFAAERFAVLTEDEHLGRPMVYLGRSVDRRAEPREEHWLTLLLAKFGDHLSFEQLAKRLRPSGLSFAIKQRGNRRDEIDAYAGCLDQEWRRIMSAQAPGTERLPEIELSSEPDGNVVGLPELYEPVTPHSIRLDTLSSWTSGSPTGAESALKEFFRTDPEERVRELNEDRHRRIDSILAAWESDAFQWYGRKFSVQAMDQLYQQFPSLVERWVEPALQTSLTGFSVRVSLGSFLEPICRVLLNRNPQLGLKLWEILHKPEGNSVIIDTIDIAFNAEDGSESRFARQTVFDECWNDASIARVAIACDRWHRASWRDDAIQSLISDQRLWKRAKGLTLASVSDITQECFEDLISKAEVAGSWVDENLRPLREDIRKNSLARHWYSVFLTTKDSDTAWGALQIALSLADERLLNWRAEVEKTCADSEIAQKRLRFLSLGWSGRELRQEISREKARQERLFGIKIQTGEIVPFM